MGKGNVMPRHKKRRSLGELPNDSLLVLAGRSLTTSSSVVELLARGFWGLAIGTDSSEYIRIALLGMVKAKEG
jgi:hypothetical protein